MLDINMSDVLKVLETCKPYLIGFAIVAIAGLILSIACIKMKQEKKFLIRTQCGIAVFLALITVVNLICFGPMSTIISLAMGNGTIDENTAQSAQELAENIADEGIVLLKNNNNILPLSDTENINVFGWASTNPCYGGTGSGGLNSNYETVSLIQGLENSGYHVNQELVDFYTNYRSDRPAVSMLSQDWTLPEPTAEAYSKDLMSAAKEYSDKAIVVISRVGGEGADLPQDVSKVNYTNNSEDYDDFPAGEHYLQLSQTEKNMLELVCENFNDVILVYNSSNAFELGFVDEYPQIKGVILCAGPGQRGFNSLGEIIKGTVNPSGKTVDTFVKDMEKAPWWNNFGDFKYTNMEEYSTVYIDQKAAEFGFPAENDVVPSFVNYVEDIYVGYKYYETAATDGAIVYEDLVQYPLVMD